MTAYDDAVQRYFAAWNATTAEELVKAVAAAFTESATYTDPLAHVRGHEGLATAISGAHQQFPGSVFQLTGTPDGHHDIVRFSWDLVSTADGSAPAAGSDVITLADDGRIASVSGFLDRVPGA
ncbi:nuclear transport factor 2 family protein [Streptomyces sp. NBC_01591]|uniref:nuclear transport factor 2 family protein n=1 Tax=Streptomyces sp. NBC_01591 TaxID=2975888 RepID=UPI002DD9629A|nr:nuclear transport factor 2 family protein [Streptomyces sp. NBC_01591]WSD71643.1 nuclear transport factor 2 family protein [Streptomyces sp. NBC_01591]